MRNNISITAVLVALLLLVTALFGGFALTYRSVYTTMRSFQGYARAMEAQIGQVARNRAVFAALVNETAEYSKKNPAMAALLQQYAPAFEQLGLQTKPAAPGTGKPSR